jgi:biopolymer transport protein ExbD
MQVNGGAESGLQSEINVTPLVDVVLVLLIIFMVVVPLLLQGYDVEIPRTSADPTQVQADLSQVVLSIGPEACRILEAPEGDGLPADCRVSLDENQIPAADLPRKMSELFAGRPADQRVLFLAVDDRLNYEGVLRIVDLAKSGVDDLAIEVITAD